MPKMKTRKAVSKRFKKSKRGKVKAKGMEGRDRRRKLPRKVLSRSQAKRIKKMMPEK